MSEFPTGRDPVEYDAMVGAALLFGLSIGFLSGTLLTCIMWALFA